MIDPKSKQQFHDLWKLVKKNWSKELLLPNSFIFYFENEYINTLKVWYIGAFIGKNHTNNSLESTNSKIKSIYFDHKKRTFLDSCK